MEQNEKIRSLAKRTALITSAHAFIYYFLNIAHENVDTLYRTSEFMPILLLFCLAPFAASLLLFTQTARQGAVVLIGLLPAALLYNCITRFVVVHLAHFQEPSVIWKILYETAFSLSLIIEAIAFWFAFVLLKEIHKQLR